MPTLIQQFVSKEGREDLTWVVDALGNIRSRMDDINGKGIKIEVDLKGVNNLKEYLLLSAELRKENESLAKQAQMAANTRLLTAKAINEENKAKRDSIKADQDAKKEIDAYIKSVKEAQKELDKLTKEYEKAQKATAKMADKAAANEIKSQEAAMKRADAAAAQYEKQMAALKKETDKLEAATRKEQEALERASRAYNILDSAHKRLVRSAQDIGAELGVESKEFLEASANANRLGDRLKAIDGQLGNHRRNVGNYASAWNGLSTSIGYLVSELPNAAQSPEIFFRSMSNNILPLTNHIAEARAQNALLIEQGKASIPVWKQVAGALLSWQTAIAVGITLLVAYGPKVWQFLTGSSEAAEKAKKANEKYAESLKSIEQNARATANEEIARLTVLNSIATDTTQSLKSRKKAVDEMQKLYPEYLGNIKDEILLQGQAAGKIDEVTQALLQNATAMAAQKKFAAAQERVYDLTLAQRKAEDELTKARAKRVSDAIDDTNKDAEGRGLDQFFNTSKVSEAKKNLADISGALKTASDDAMVYLSDAQKAGAKAFELFKPKDEKTPRVKDTENLEINLRRTLNDKIAELDKENAAAELEREKEKQRLIIDSDHSTQEQKADARKRYTALVLGLAKLEEVADIDKNENEHKATIDRINHSFKSEKDINELLLLEKERFEKEKQAIAEKYRTIEEKAMGELTAAIIEDNDKYTARARTNLEGLSNFFQSNELFSSNRGDREKQLEKGLDIAGRSIDLFSQLSDLMGTTYDKEIAKQQEAIQGINDKRDVDIAAINASAKSKEQKEKEIAVVEANALSQRLDRERQLKDAQKAKARFEKAVTIQQILADTALAAIRALGMKPYTPFNIAQAAIISAIGATKAATVAATPIPEFFMGTNSSPEGIAWVGERGPEIKITPSGKVSLTPGSATLDYLEKGTQIIPNDKTREILQTAELASIYGFSLPRTKETNTGMLTRQQMSNANTNADKIVQAILTANRPASTPTDKYFNRYHTTQIKN